MKSTPSPEIANNLAIIRGKRGLSAAELSSAVGVTRQTIYAMEAESYIPNTVVALRLAQVLEVRVEDLFSLSDGHPLPDLPSADVTLLAGSEPLQPGQPVQLCRVDKRLMASAPSPMPWFLPASDAIVTGKAKAARTTNVQICHEDGDFQNRILIAGCDPGISVLARHVRTAGIELVLAHRNSSQSLSLLREGSVHIAGTHLRDEATGESNIPQIGEIFPKDAVALISFAVWEEGILMSRENPKNIRGIEDFIRKDVSIVNRETGAGARALLDSHLKRLKIDPEKVTGYQRSASGHLAAAWQVRTGLADCCIATRASARVFGLGFIPLVSERYDLAMRRQHLDLPSIRVFLDALNRASFRRELEGIGGYDAKAAGQRLL